MGVEFVVSYVEACPYGEPFSNWGGILDAVPEGDFQDRLYGIWAGSEWWRIAEGPEGEAAMELLDTVFREYVRDALDCWGRQLTEDPLISAAIALDPWIDGPKSEEWIHAALLSKLGEADLQTFHGFNLTKIAEQLRRKSEGYEKWFLP